MLFTLKELVKWLGLTAFEIGVTLFSVTIFAVLTVLKYERGINVNWWTVFVPLFTCDGLNCYFCIIVFIRMYLEGIYKNAAFRAIWSFSIIVLLFVLKLLICQKLEGIHTLSYSEAMTPFCIFLYIVLMLK
uniref:Transmembrane protein 203 n=1 Tax=Strigamia maritima TaxID=126957 RepID=T1J7M0_STRMM